jgi:hypothetical protein
VKFRNLILRTCGQETLLLLQRCYYTHNDTSTMNDVCTHHPLRMDLSLINGQFGRGPARALLTESRTDGAAQPGCRCQRHMRRVTVFSLSRWPHAMPPDPSPASANSPAGPWTPSQAVRHLDCGPTVTRRVGPEHNAMAVGRLAKSVLSTIIRVTRVGLGLGWPPPPGRDGDRRRLRLPAGPGPEATVTDWP